jgi:hypothetical protein
VFVPGNPFQPSLMFSDKARAYPSETPFRYSTNKARLLALPTNIRLGWKSLPGTNTGLLQKLIHYVHWVLGPMLKIFFARNLQIFVIS